MKKMVKVLLGAPLKVGGHVVAAGTEISVPFDEVLKSLAEQDKEREDKKQPAVPLLNPAVEYLRQARRVAEREHRAGIAGLLQRMATQQTATSKRVLSSLTEG